MKNAFLFVDIQRDFCPGGALAVADGDSVVPVANRLSALAARHGCPAFFSRDWHPVNHVSFAASGGPWPPHCVAQTPGAQFADGLTLPPESRVISKGTSPDRDAYSAFDRTGLAELIRRTGAERLFVCGLATDYCVAATVKDALTEGFAVSVVQDGCRAVNVSPSDGDRALEEMRRAGALLTDSAAVAELLQ